ncbi:MAG: metallophosphoesterase family protein [Hyphomicrobiales bacterium]
MSYTVVIGDIHGMADMLRRLLRDIDGWLDSHNAKGTAQFIFLGDYIDVGPDSKGVIDQVRKRQGAGAICLRGNHEQLMIDSTESHLNEQNFLFNGGASTRASLGASFGEAQAWMETLPTFHEDDLRYYVHAGLRPNVPIEQQGDYSRLWIRDEFLRYRGRFPKYVVHGHTPTIRFNAQKLTPDIRDNRCNVDNGVVIGGPLSAAIFNKNKTKPIYTYSVKP